jgi:hypothetical protein
MTMQKNETTKDIIQGGDRKKGMFLSIWPNSQCRPLTKSFLVLRKLLILKIEFFTVGAIYKVFEH